jgi:hypothetical protein
MARVPILAGAGVVEAGENGCGGTLPVGSEHGFPYGEDLDLRAGVALEDLLDRGRPPQTGGSSGGEENDEAGAIEGAIEIGAQGGEVHGGERGLSGRRLMLNECAGGGEREQGRREEEGEGALRRTLHRSARRFARI